MAKSFLNSIGSGLKIQFRPKGRFQDHSWPFLTIFCPFVCCPNIYCIVQFSKCWQMAKSFLNSIGSGLKIQFRPKGRFQDHSLTFSDNILSICLLSKYLLSSFIVQFSKCWQMAKSFLNSIGSGLKIQFRPKRKISRPLLTFSDNILSICLLSKYLLYSTIFKVLTNGQIFSKFNWEWFKNTI